MIHIKTLIIYVLYKKLPYGVVAWNRLFVQISRPLLRPATLWHDGHYSVTFLHVKTKLVEIIVHATVND